MKSRLEVQHEYTNRAIENKALLSWINSKEVDVPDLSRSKHFFLFEPHMYGAGCCGWRRHFILMSASRTIGVFSVSRLNSASPQLHRLRIVPRGLLEGKAISLAMFYRWEAQQKLNAEWEAEWEKLLTEQRARLNVKAETHVQEVAQAELKTNGATIFGTAFASAAQTVDRAELDELLGELGGIAA